MDKNIFERMSSSYDRIHLEETQLKNGKKNIIIKPQIKLLFGWSVFILCAVLAFVFVLSPGKKNDSTTKDSKDNVSTEQIVNQDEHKTTVPYEKDAYADLNEFMEKYYKAITDCDNETLQAMVTNPDIYDTNDDLKKKAEFIKEYTNLTVYTKKSIEDGNFVVYVVSNVSIAGVNSALYDIQKFYVVNGERGYMINNGELSEEVTDFINTVTADKDIQKVYASVKKENEKLEKSDVTIKEQFYDVINKDKSE